MPKVGRKTPVKLQNLDKYGRELILIKSFSDLDKLTKDTVGIIGARFGFKKKLMIAKKIVDKKFKFLNFRPENIIKEAKDKILNKKAKKEKKIVAVKETVTKPKAKPAKPTTVVKKPVKEVKEVKATKQTKGEK